MLLLLLCFAVACAESEQSVSEELFDAGNVQAIIASITLSADAL